MILMILFVIVGVTYLTILEQKVLGYLQFHKDSNKIGFLELLQLFNDGLNLLRKKDDSLIYKVNYFIYYIYPMMLIVFILLF